MLPLYREKATQLRTLYPRKSLALCVLVAVGILTLTPLVEWVIGFLISGTIPGTTWSVPYWVMLTLHVGALLVVLLVLIEDYLYTKEAVKKYTAKQRTRRRNYGHTLNNRQVKPLRAKVSAR